MSAVRSRTSKNAKKGALAAAIVGFCVGGPVGAAVGGTIAASVVSAGAVAVVGGTPIFIMKPINLHQEQQFEVLMLPITDF